MVFLAQGRFMNSEDLWRQFLSWRRDFLKASCNLCFISERLESASTSDANEFARWLPIARRHEVHYGRLRSRYALWQGASSCSFPDGDLFFLREDCELYIAYAHYIIDSYKREASTSDR